jgi:flagellar basal body rod protein FlgC
MNRLTGQSGNDYKGGVRISSVEEDDTLGDLIYDQSHPAPTKTAILRHQMWM